MLSRSWFHEDATISIIFGIILHINIDWLPLFLSAYFCTRMFQSFGKFCLLSQLTVPVWWNLLFVCRPLCKILLNFCSMFRRKTDLRWVKKSEGIWIYSRGSKKIFMRFEVAALHLYYHDDSLYGCTWTILIARIYFRRIFSYLYITSFVTRAIHEYVLSIFLLLLYHIILKKYNLNYLFEILVIFVV